jgi:PAS domain S-box-containing protein
LAGDFVHRPIRAIHRFACNPGYIDSQFTLAFIWGWRAMRARVIHIAMLLLLSHVANYGLAAEEHAKRVLILDSFGRRAIPSAAVISALRAELTRLRSEPIDFYEDSLDATRISAPEPEEALVDILTNRLGGSPADLVITVGAPAMRFIASRREQFFNDMPVLAVSFDQRHISPELRTDHMTSVGIQVDPPGLIDGILEVLPDTRNIYVVIGASRTEKFWKNVAQPEFLRFEDRVTFHWWDELPLAEMQKRVASLPPNSVVLYTFLVRDAAGVAVDHDQALADLQQASNSPIFGCYENQLGLGIVGGRLLPVHSLGLRAAQVADRILRGEDAAQISTPPMKSLPPVFDGRELLRWGINESRLPQGSAVLYRPPSLWEAYRWQMLGIGGLVLLQSLLITGLFAQRIRRGRAERALADNEKRLRLITNSLPVLIAYVDQEQRYQFNNQAFQSWFGIDPETVRGRTLWDIKGERFYSQVRPFVERALAGEQVSFAADTVLDDGRRLVVEGIHVPDRDEHGVTRGFYSLVMDVTARNQAQQEAGRLQDELAHAGRVSLMGVLAAALAHELNQPLTAIMSNAQAAQRFLKSPSPNLHEVAEILEDITMDDERASEVIRRLRALVKKEPSEFKLLDVAEMIRGVERLTHKNATMRNMSVALDVDHDLPQIRGDRVQLQQVLLNLLLNAFDATANGGSESQTVAVSARKENSQVVIEVRDHGVGIPDEIYNRLFELFQSSKKQGLGMGLSISKSIVERHNGRLWAENNPDRGATFYLCLPIAQVEAEAHIKDIKYAEPVTNGLRGG